MKYLTAHSGLSDKWFYALVKSGRFPKPIKLGRSSRWRKSDYFHWLEDKERQRKAKS
ncbi:TPA: AlpA family phage regulatory protein [Citrobacter farmeri]|nr:AlpA family phage regulatory protein [Escherichia coli]ELR0704298.1 AlpA family phage regulatory protein [Escherichia coli]HEM8564169.1 AlpA family phage regulatory protein [Citrobacter farmeri]